MKENGASKLYKVIAIEWEHGYEMIVKGVGVTQAEDLWELWDAARDYLSLELGGDPESYPLLMKFAHSESELSQAELYHLGRVDACPSCGIGGDDDTHSDDCTLGPP